MSKAFYKKYDGKLTKVVNVYFVDQEDVEYKNVQTGLVLELEDGRFMTHAQDGYVVPFSEVKDSKEESVGRDDG